MDWIEKLDSIPLLEEIKYLSKKYILKERNSGVEDKKTQRTFPFNR